MVKSRRLNKRFVLQNGQIKFKKTKGQNDEKITN